MLLSTHLPSHFIKQFSSWTAVGEAICHPFQKQNSEPPADICESQVVSTGEGHKSLNFYKKGKAEKMGKLWGCLWNKNDGWPKMPAQW